MEGDTPHVLGGGNDLESTGTSNLRQDLEQELRLEEPFCHGMEELPTARKERSRVIAYLEGSRQSPTDETIDPTLPLFRHLEEGLALTVGSALGSVAPSVEVCLAAFEVPNAALLTAGSRAWTKHAHRSQPVDEGEEEEATKRRRKSDGWWGSPSGPVSKINEKAITLFWKIIKSATWRNLHWLPHRVLVYEVRVAEGYGMRWSQDQGKDVSLPWVFRGFVEPMMENGHEVGWRHAVTL